MKLSPDVGNNQRSPHMQRNPTIDVHILSHVLQCEMTQGNTIASKKTVSKTWYWYWSLYYPLGSICCTAGSAAR